MIVPAHPPQFAPHLSSAQVTAWQKEARDLLNTLPQNEASDEAVSMLAPILAASQHLHTQSQNHASDLPGIMAGNINIIMKAAETDFCTACAEAKTDSHLMPAVRHFRYRCSFAIAFSELWGHIDIETSCQMLTSCAEIAVRGVVQFLLQAERSDSQNWVIFALGKLGAGELNYSSDIDLIAIHENNHEEGSHAARNHAGGTKPDYPALARRLSYILSHQTGDGFGWRVDFRLRPDPSATPLSLDFDAAVSYYETMGRAWERAAFIRARPIAGDLALGHQFLHDISSFIWRRHFDYTIIEDLQIWLKHDAETKDYFGFDVKQGAFGIRHIELLVHILQLVGGGRHADFRCPQTRRALTALTKSGWISPEQADALISAYYQWRYLEHRVQYQRDNHSHKLPREHEGMAVFAAFCGFASRDDLTLALTQLQACTAEAARHPILDRMLETRTSTTPSPAAAPAATTFTIQHLESLGYQRAQDIAHIIAGWAAGRQTATRGERARRYLWQCLPGLLTALAKAGDPDTSFARFAELISKLSIGAQPFALLAQNPQLNSLICTILTKAPSLTDQLGAHPALFDNLLEADFFLPLQKNQHFDAMTKTESGPESGPEYSTEIYLETLKIWVQEARFRAKTHFLLKLADPAILARHLSDIADTAISGIARQAFIDFAARYGKIEGASLTIIGLGRLGSRTLSAGSDIDLLFVYDGPEDSHSQGGHAPNTPSLGLSVYFIRLTQQIISWLNLASGQGRLFDVDLRLRPDGKAGPVAIHVKRLDNYFQNEAWAWEHVAWLKARPITSVGTATDRVEKTLKKIRQSFPPLQDVRANIQVMRDKLHGAETPDPKMPPMMNILNLKKRKGGALDLEFLAVLLALEAKSIRINFGGANFGGHNFGGGDFGLSPIQVLEIASQKTSGLDSLKQQARQLEMLIQLCPICLPRHPSPSKTDRSDHDLIPYLPAMAESAGLADADALLHQIEYICTCIDERLSLHLSLKK